MGIYAIVKKIRFISIIAILISHIISIITFLVDYKFYSTLNENLKKILGISDGIVYILSSLFIALFIISQLYLIFSYVHRKGFRRGVTC